MQEKLLNILNNYDVSLENITNIKNSFIDFPIYVINLENDIYRRAHIKFITSIIGLNYTLVKVKPISDETKNIIDEKNKKGMIGCFLSHLWCIKNAIENNHKYFLIFEDDIIFHKNFESLFKKINYKKYDMLQLGCCDFNLNKNIANIDLSKNKGLFIYNPKEIALGAYGNIYNLNFAKLIYYEKLNEFSEFDTKFNLYY